MGCDDMNNILESKIDMTLNEYLDMVSKNNELERTVISLSKRIDSLLKYINELYSKYGYPAIEEENDE